MTVVFLAPGYILDTPQPAPRKSDAIVVISGDAALQIVRAATLKCADLVVMATRGDRASRAPKIGSVTEAVVAHSAVPVLVVPI